MKKIYAFVFTLAVMATQVLQAQNCGARYHDQIFQNVTITSNITYTTSNNTNLKLDVYEPTGDTASMRPLMILAHGGSFIGGSKTQDGVVTQLCNSFAKRGYVCAAINYRLGGIFDMFADSTAKDVVMKAISDGKSAIRFFKKDAATNNTYKIDPSKVFVGGNSAGAVLYAHCVFIDSVNEAPASLRNIINLNGGIEGNSGNDGYSSEATALVNLAGGLNEAYFVGPGNKPSFNAQGDADNTVPYMCANAQGGATPVQLCGLGAMQPYYTQYSLPHHSIVYPGAGHCPWQSSAAMMTEIDTTLADFLYDYACSGVISSVKDVELPVKFSVFPNPAKDMLNISFADYGRVKSVQLINALGQIVTEVPVTEPVVSLERGNLSSGVYFVKVITASSSSSVKKIMFE